MYYRLNEGKVLDYSDSKYLDDCIKTDIITAEEYAEHPNKVMVKGKKLVINPDYEHEAEQEEQDRVNNLTMTPLDFIKVLEQLGLTLTEINEFLDTHIEIKTQLTYCNLVYCGVAKSFLPQTIGEVTITPEMAEQAFKLKNGEVK